MISLHSPAVWFSHFANTSLTSLSVTHRYFQDASCGCSCRKKKQTHLGRRKRGNKCLQRRNTIPEIIQSQVKSGSEPSPALNKAAIGYLSPISPHLPSSPTPPTPFSCMDAYACPCSLSLPLVSLWNAARLVWRLEPLRGTLGNDRDTSTQARTFREHNAAAVQSACGRLLL